MTTADRTNPEHQVAITRVSETTINVWNNGRTIAFAPEALDELARMWYDLHLMPTVQRMTNFVEALPTLTPIHANRPQPKATLEDLA